MHVMQHIVFNLPNMTLKPPIIIDRDIKSRFTSLSKNEFSQVLLLNRNYHNRHTIRTDIVMEKGIAYLP